MNFIGKPQQIAFIAQANAPGKSDPQFTVGLVHHWLDRGTARNWIQNLSLYTVPGLKLGRHRLRHA